MCKNENKKENTNYLPLILLSIGVVLLYFSSWLLIGHFINTPEEQGQFGDQFGAVNALFSGLAFAGLIFTIILQKKELSLQREELADTRKELKGQKLQLVEQNKTLRIQRFENTFFNMMELQQQIVSGMKFQNKQIIELRKETSEEIRGYRNEQTPIDFEVTGRGLFSWSFQKMPHKVKIDTEHTSTLAGMKSVLAEYGLQEYLNQESATIYDHYFRHLYTILKFIDKEDIPETDKRIFSDEELYGYAKILRATLSRYELVWLYYNGLSGYGNTKLKPLLEKYCMLKNLREDLLSCCKDNRDELAKAGVSIKEVTDAKCSGTDYEFYLTTERNKKDKYHYSAFYKSVDEQTKGINLINKWKDYLDDKRKQLEISRERMEKSISPNDIIIIGK